MEKEELSTDEDVLAEQKFSIEKELDAVISSMNESGKDIIKLIKLCIEMRESLAKGTKEQLFAWDRVIKDYEFFEEDVDVNGERVKKITSALMEKAKAAKINKDTLDIFKKKESWSFDW